MNPLPGNISIGDKYGPAMRLQTQPEADEYFERLVEHTMRMLGCARYEAESVERSNLGYYAGYGFDRERVERLFRCEHPIFGRAEFTGPISPREAYMAGLALSRRARSMP